MNSEEFQKASLVRLEELTGVDCPRWSRYLSGKVAINDRTLRRIARKLNMPPDQLLGAILIRREAGKEGD